MAYQTPVDDKYAASVRGGLRENFAALAHDVLTLAELQVHLLAVDVREAQRWTGAAFIQLIVGVLFGVGSIPLMLMAAAYALMAALQCPPAIAFALVGVTAAVCAALAIRWSCLRLTRALSPLDRSRTEFVETLGWLKSSLRDVPKSPDDAATTQAEVNRCNGHVR
ncbi:MAG: phage holin family protein [Planctomycetaceae bacterium]